MYMPLSKTNKLYEVKTDKSVRLRRQMNTYGKTSTATSSSDVRQHRASSVIDASTNLWRTWKRGNSAEDPVLHKVATTVFFHYIKRVYVTTISTHIYIYIRAHLFRKGTYGSIMFETEAGLCLLESLIRGRTLFPLKSDKSRAWHPKTVYESIVE